jgi:RHS repeat-associated protein
VQRLDYGPWGALEQITGTVADTNRLGWKGLVWEGDSTRLYYVRARWYDPASRRFISEDPSGLAGGINQYAFARNDPVGKTDPTGMRECSIAMFTDGFMCPGSTSRGINTLGLAGRVFGWGSGDAIDQVLSSSAQGCRHFSPQQCEDLTSAIDRLKKHGDKYCKEAGRNAERRLQTGAYSYDPRLRSVGLSYPVPIYTHFGFLHNFTVRLGETAFLDDDEVLITVAHEEFHIMKDRGILPEYLLDEDIEASAQNCAR